MWTPLFTAEREMQSFFNRLEKFFGGQPELSAWRVATDMYRENGDLVINVELPGLDPAKDVQIELEGDVLHIRGEKTGEKEIRGENRYLKERLFGSFDRRIPLPDGVDVSAVKATFDKGVLTVKVAIPVEAETAPKKIPVTVT